MQSKIHKITKINVASFCVAYLLMFRGLSNVALLGVKSSLLNMLFLFILVGLTGLVLIFRGKNKQGSDVATILSMCFVVFVYILHVLIEGMRVSVIELLIYSIIPLLLATVKIET